MTKKEQRQKVKEKCDGKCAYCGETLGDKFHVDHLEAVQRKSKYISGKGFVPTGEMRKPENDNFENLMPACVSCNIQKASLSLDVFREVIENKINVLNNNSTPYKIAKRYGLIEEKPKKIVFYFEEIDKGTP